MNRQIIKYTLIGIVGVVTSIFLLLVFLPRPFYKTGFSTINDLQQYASSIDEFIKMENENYLKPEYTQYYKRKFSYGFFDKIRDNIRWLGCLIKVSKPPYFSPSFFKTILEKNTKHRLDKGLQGSFINKISLKKSSKIIVIGVLQGAYHSLVRTLTKLRDLKIIDDTLRLTSPDYYIVQLGNVVNRSPYTLETLTIMLKLIERNPDQVFYCKGTNEFDFYWRQHTLAQELQGGLAYLSSEKIPLEKDIDSFFNTLPLEVDAFIDYLGTHPIPYIALSAFIEDEKLREQVNPKKYASYLLQQSGSSLVTHKLKDNQEDDPRAGEIVLKSTVRDIRKRDSFESMDGLRLLAREGDAVAWTVLSSPTEPYRKAFKFMYDAFAVITLDEQLEKSILTLYSRNIMDPLPVTYKERWVYVFTGQDNNSTVLKSVSTSNTGSAQEDSTQGTSQHFVSKKDKKEQIIQTPSTEIKKELVSQAKEAHIDSALNKQIIDEITSLKADFLDAKNKFFKELEKYDIVSVDAQPKFVQKSLELLDATITSTPEIIQRVSTLDEIGTLAHEFERLINQQSELSKELPEGDAEQLVRAIKLQKLKEEGVIIFEILKEKFETYKKSRN